MSLASFLHSHSKLLHSIGDALKILQSATPLIGADGAKVKSIIQSVHDAAHQAGEIAKTVDSGVTVDHSAISAGIHEVLPGLLAEGISLALDKLLPAHTAAVVEAATPTVIEHATPAVVEQATPVVKSATDHQSGN